MKTVISPNRCLSEALKEALRWMYVESRSAPYRPPIAINGDLWTFGHFRDSSSALDAIEKAVDSITEVEPATASEEAAYWKTRALRAENERNMSLRGSLVWSEEKGWYVGNRFMYVNQQAQRLYAVRLAIEAGNPAEFD